MRLRIAVIGISAALAATTLGAGGAAARTGPTPITVPGGLRPGGVAPAAALDVPTCVDEHKCTEVKDTSSAPSCTGYSSHTTPPATIRVLVRTGSTVGTYTITTVPFEQYLENVLPVEWTPTWDGDALKAGAVAVRSYAWYWVTHYGGYVGSTRSATSCFDVTDDYLFQTYLPGSATARTNTAVVSTRQVAARVGGKILQASYQSYLQSPTEGCGAGANGTVLSQDGTQACNDSDTSSTGSTLNKYNVILAKYYYPGLQLATLQQERTAHDFTFEQTSTRATFASGIWSFDDGYHSIVRFGAAGDIPTITDDGDGFAHMGVFRPSTGTWYLSSPTGSIAQQIVYGRSGDVPVPGHWNGIGQPSVIAFFRPSTSSWYVSGQPTAAYGQSGDIPVPADYNGDGRTDIAIWRPSTGQWWVHGSSPVTYGVKGDIPVPADYNGDGRTDIAIYRPSTHQFWIRGQAPVTYGVAGDIPVTGDYTGDGKADKVMYRPSTHTWYVYGAAAAVFTASGTPIGAAPYRG